jgi:hypothetical protein
MRSIESQAYPNLHTAIKSLRDRSNPKIIAIYTPQSSLKDLEARLPTVGYAND